MYRYPAYHNNESALSCTYDAISTRASSCARSFQSDFNTFVHEASILRPRPVEMVTEVQLHFVLYFYVSLQTLSTRV